MSIERRLHHAARELREVPIEVPPLRGVPRVPTPRHGARRPRLAALAAPLLFVGGGVLAVGVLQRQVPEPPHSDIPAAPAVVDAGPVSQPGAGDGPSTPSVRDELQLIAGILDEAVSAAATEPTDSVVTPRFGPGPS